MPTDESFEVYLRNADGDTYHAGIREGLEKFLSDEGYRISIDIEGVEITLRKGITVDQDMRWLDKQLDRTSVDCVVTIGPITYL